MCEKATLCYFEVQACICITNWIPVLLILVNAFLKNLVKSMHRG